MSDGVGPTLREARERRQIPITEVEEATKIRARFLRAIENEEWDVLPGSAYARSFIRTYADFLGLDGARLAAEHQQAPAAAAGPHVEPDPIGPGSLRGRSRVSRGRVLTAVVCAALVALIVVIGLSGDDGGKSAPKESKQSSSANHLAANGGGRGEGLSMDLAATGEVWVCVLDDTGRELVEGEILPSGGEAGPFHSGSFTVAFGNGAVAMNIDGKEAEIPETASPIGYEIDSKGELTQLADAERPTCQ